MHRLQQIRQTLKRGLLSTGQFASKPQHKLIAVITVQGSEKVTANRNCEKEVFLAIPEWPRSAQAQPPRAPPRRA